MSKLTWDKIGERLYETGTKKGVSISSLKGQTRSYPISERCALERFDRCNRKPIGSRGNGYICR